MTISARPKFNLKGNGYLLGSSLLSWGALTFMPPANSPGWAWIATGVLAYGAAYFAMKGVAALHENYQLRKALHAAQHTDTEDDDRFASYAEKKAAGMYEPTGRLLGTDLDGTLLFEPTAIKPAFQLFEGAQGTAKTSSQALPSAILTPLTTGKSVYLGDPKTEITPMIRDGLKKLDIPLVEIEVGAKKRGDPYAIETPPFELAIDAYLSDDAEIYSKTNIFIRGYSRTVVPDHAAGKENPWFTSGGQNCFRAIFTGLLVMSPEKANPTEILNIASDPDRTVEFLERFINAPH